MAFIKINKQNFYHNLNQIALKTGSIKKIAIVLKDNAYGHGLEIIAQMASEFGIEHAVVRDQMEAQQVKQYFKSVLVLAGKACVDDICSFAINSLEDMDKVSKGMQVELKIDTGMHRNGIEFSELDSALALIEEKGLILKGIMTHFRSADVLSSELFWQQKCFEAIKQTVQSKGYENVRFHSCNSAAILRVSDFDEDLVRVGIAAYGYNELPEVFESLALKPVLTLHAKKVSSRNLTPGARIGYGDGWLRNCSSKAYHTQEGLAVLGRVSMDLMTFESTEDEICILSNAQVAAAHFNTISYEIITALNSSIERIVVEED